MLLRKNAYFDQFTCIAAACPDSCCKEWDVQVDAAAAELYRSLPGALGDRLRQVLRDEDGETVMTIEDGRCPMWRSDGLCRIQAELGHDALCHTCREFPRLTHDYGDFIEMGLELSCPEAARLILNAPPAPPTVTETDGSIEPEYDREAMKVLLQTRENALALLQDTSRSVPEALALVLIYGYQAQAQLDGDNGLTFDPELSLQQAREMGKPADTAQILRFFSDLEILTDAWRSRLATPEGGSWQEGYRNLARYGIERYWLQAVSDYDLVGRVKFILISCLTVKILGGDLLNTAQLYSKEIENSTENVEAILDAAYDNPVFTDDKLLWLLLH